MFPLRRETKSGYCRPTYSWTVVGWQFVVRTVGFASRPSPATREKHPADPPASGGNLGGVSRVRFFETPVAPARLPDGDAGREATKLLQDVRVDGRVTVRVLGGILYAKLPCDHLGGVTLWQQPLALQRTHHPLGRLLPLRHEM